jgi:hypothetical protein
MTTCMFFLNLANLGWWTRSSFQLALVDALTINQRLRLRKVFDL